MSFLGNTPTTQSFTSLTERFNGDGSTTTITLSRAVYNASDIEVIVNNVQQDPYDAYTVNGTQTLTFTEAPSVGTGNIIVTYRNYTITKFVPAEGTVTAAAIADGSITGVKIASATITGDKIGLTAITGNLIAAAAITGDKIAAATIGSSNLTTTGVSAGTYGGATQIPVVTVGTDGRVTFSANVAFSAVPTFSSGPFAVANASGAIANTSLDVYGGVAMNVVTLATTSNTVNVALANYFISTPAGASTWVFTGVPVSRDSSFVLQITNGGTYTTTWPASVKWPANTAPTLTSSGVDLLIFSTANTGTTWRGSSLIGYTA
jgi:hypothetical protein